MKFTRPFTILAFLVTFYSAAVIAQSPVTGTDKLLDKLRLNRGIEGKENLYYDDVQGDPFIFRDFHEGTLYVLPDKEYKVSVRFDVYADQMHLKDSNEIYAIIHPEKVKLIEAGDYKFIYSAYVRYPGDTDPLNNSYLILKADGKCQLLVKRNIRVQDAELPKLYQEAKPAKFIYTSDTYFLKLKGMSAVRIKNKKELLTVLNDKSVAIDKFISSNKLDVKDLDDLIKIVSYYNTL